MSKAHRKHRAKDDLQADELTGEGIGGEFKIQRVRLIKAQADRVELETGLAEGRAVWLEDVRDELTRRFSVMKQRCLGLPVMLAPRIVGFKTPREVEPVIREAIENLLTELADESTFAESVQVETRVGRVKQKSATSSKVKRVSVGGRKARTKSRR